MHQHDLTNGYTTITREEVGTGDLFDLVHDLLERIDGLEWAFACLTLITLNHMDIIGKPEDPRGYADTMGALQDWLHHYRLGQERMERDRQFMDAPE